MQYYILHPQGYGYIGEKSVASDDIHRFSTLHYVFEHPPDDDVVNVAIPSGMLVTPAVAAALQVCTGYETRDVLLGFDAQIKIAYPKAALRANYLWLRIVGNAFTDDFGVFENTQIISERVVDILKPFKTSRAEIIASEGYKFGFEAEMERMDLQSIERMKALGLPLPRNYKG
jgi:hypothetical protein